MDGANREQARERGRTEPVSQNEASERELVDSYCSHGDESAFRALYRLHTPLLYRVALRFLGGMDDAAADVVQDTWIRAGRNLPAFRWESSLSTWLVGIVINRSREELRRRTRARVDASEPPEAPVVSASGAERLDLDRAILHLPDGYREILVLHDIEGYTHEEIGRLLGIDPGTSKSQLSRARHALRASLSPAPVEGES